MNRHRSIRVILPAGLLVLLVCASASAGPVYYKNGRLYRNTAANDNPDQRNWEVKSKPCGYGEHEAVLGPIVDLVRTKAPGYSFSRGAGFNNNIDHTMVCCGGSASAMVDSIRASGLLPAGWKAVRVDSFDILTMPGVNSSSHTAYMLEAPDGTSYLMDSYFYKAEITKMKKVENLFYEPVENNHNFAAKGYLQLFANFNNKWLVVADDYNYYRRQDQSKTLDKVGNGGKTDFLTSYDPNDIHGPSGAGEARYIGGMDAMNYTIRFENLATASLAAAEVRVDGMLDALVLDLGSVQFDRVRFGEIETVLPANTQDYTTDVDLRPGQNLVVRVHAWLDAAAGSVRWTFTTLDADTLALPEDFSAGFLPPNTNPPAGEGAVSFSVRPRNDLRTGDQISTHASIQFDMNDPISTPVWTNTIDNTVPDSAVSPLPAAVDTPDFDVQWTGTDADAGVSGFTLYVSADGGAYVPFTTEKEAGTTAFPGVAGHSYAFYTLAEDTAGNRQPVPAAAQATVSVNAAPAEGEDEGEGENEGEGEGGEGTGCQGCSKSSTSGNSKGDRTALAFAGALMAVGSLTRKR